MNDLNITFNSVQCLKTIGSWGSTEFVNICNGVSKTVPWGSFDWTLVLGGFSSCLAAIAVIAAPIGFVAYQEYSIYKQT